MVGAEQFGRLKRGLPEPSVWVLGSDSAANATWCAIDDSGDLQRIAQTWPATYDEIEAAKAKHGWRTSIPGAG